MAKKASKTKKTTFNREQFVNISQTSFAPNWSPENADEAILFYIKGIKNVEQVSKKGKKRSNDFAVLECKLIQSMDATFRQGKNKDTVSLDEGDEFTIMLSSAFVCDSSNGTKLAFESNTGEILLTNLGQIVLDEEYQVFVRFLGMQRTKNRRNFKAFEIMVPKDALEASKA